MEDAASSMSTSDPGLSFDNVSLQDRTSTSESLLTVVETATGSSSTAGYYRTPEAFSTPRFAASVRVEK